MKTFKDQIKECKANGTLFEAKIPTSGKIALACTKYKCHCNSKVCHWQIPVIKDKEFPKAPWLNIKWVGLVKLQGKFILKPMHTRMANASNLFIPCLKITWRMPWLPQAAYKKGWDAAFRQLKKVM